MKALLIPLCALLLAAASPAVRADVVWFPFDRAVSTAHDAAPWLLVAAVVGITLLVLWRIRKKK